MNNRPWSSTAPPGEFRTYIAPEESLKEFTLRAIILGALFGLLFGAVTVYVGLRAATDHDDYQVFVDPERGYACAGGIRSTGLSASMAIAEHVRTELGAAGLQLAPKERGSTVRMPNIGEASPRPYMQGERIARSAGYGEIVCFCERVTRGEIADVLSAPVPAVDLDGLRRRTRVLMGRCQGFFCGAHVSALLAARDRSP